MKSDPASQTITASQVPPYCFMRPGMSAEAGVAEAIKVLKISHAGDALALLWKLRRVACGIQTEEVAPKGASRPQKNQPRPTAQAASLFNRGDAPEEE